MRGAAYSKGGLWFVVAEHGICCMRGKPSAERALGLIELADPTFRDELTAAARDMHLI